MQPSSAAATNTSPSAEPTETKPNMPAHGSTPTGTENTKPTFDQVLENLKTAFIAREQPKALPAQQKPLPRSIVPKPMPKQADPFTAADKVQLAVVLGQVCSMQKAYGKAPSDLESLVEGYCLLLEGFSMAQIIAALKAYMLRHQDIPSPASIAQIIDPTLAPMDAAVYRAICTKIRGGSEFVTDDEWAYKRRYEAKAMGKS